MVAVAVISHGLVVYNAIALLVYPFVVEVRDRSPFTKKYSTIPPARTTFIPAHSDAGMLRLFRAAQILTGRLYAPPG